MNLKFYKRIVELPNRYAYVDSYQFKSVNLDKRHNMEDYVEEMRMDMLVIRDGSINDMMRENY